MNNPHALGVITAVMVFQLLAAASGERPMGQQVAASPTTTPDAATMAGERLPFVATHHPPAASCSPHRPMPWAGAGDGLGGGDGEDSCMDDGTEKVAVNRKGQGGTSWGRVQESVVANNEPTKTAGTGTVTVDEETELPPLMNPDETTTSLEHEAMKVSSLNGEPANTADTAEEEELPELLDRDAPWLRNHCVVDRHDFRTGGRMYRHMLYLVDVCLLTWTERRSSEHWVLCPEPNNDPNQLPCGYVIVPLRGLRGEECALAFRADNLDLVAFANGKNRWHVFKKYAHHIPTATVLEFDNDYSDLLGTGNETIMNLPLGGTSFLQATSEISLYMKAPGVEERYIKEALLTMEIGIPEAKRFTPVRELIVSGWLEGTKLNETMVKYLPRWRELSCAVLVADKGGAWGSDKYSKILIDLGIAYSKQEASNILDVLAVPQDSESSDCP